MRRNPIAILLSTVFLTATPILATAETDPSAAAPSVINAPHPNYTDSVARLKDAAQRLREAIQAMAQQSEGPRRDRAIQAAHEALFDTQLAMVRIPPEARTGADPGPGVNHTQSMERLQQAAQKLRESVQAMAQQPAGERRAAAMREAREALMETQQAMISLPPSLRSAEGWSASRLSSSRNRNQPEREVRNKTDGLPYNDVMVTAEGARYLTGGIGLEEQARFNARADDFNLKLVFTLEEGNYIAYVDVAIRDEKGHTVIDTLADGPYLLADLAPGRYTVKATYEGKTVTRTVTVGDGTRVSYMRWPSNPKTDFIPG